MGYKNFRDVYHKLAVVMDNGWCYRDMKGLGDNRLKLPPVEANSALVYGYIDKACGFSYQVLGFTYYEDGDYTLVWPGDEIGITIRGECFQDFELIPIENKALVKRFQKVIDNVNKCYSTEDDEETRAFEELDPFRHHDFPDDVEVIIQNTELRKMERIWARVKRYEGGTDKLTLFRAELLDEPFADIYDMHYKDDIMLLLLKHEEGDSVLFGTSLNNFC